MDARLPYFIADEGDGVYNVFSIYDFENGYYAGHEGEDGYHIDDFDVVARFRTFEAAERYMDLNDMNP